MFVCFFDILLKLSHDDVPFPLSLLQCSTKCMKITEANDGGLANSDMAPADDEHRQLAKNRPVTGLHHEGHHPAASLK